MSDIFDVLADGTRRELLVTLREHRAAGAPNGELSVSELVERLGLSQPTVSKHLQKLKEHGLVSVRTNGQHHLYRLESEPLRYVRDWVATFVAGSADAPSHEGIGVSAEFAAWSGLEVGESLGRRIADSTHGARTVVTGATEQVSKRLPKISRHPDGIQP